MRVQASDSDFGDECGNQGKVGHISSKYLNKYRLPGVMSDSKYSVSVFMISSSTLRLQLHLLLSPACLVRAPNSVI